MRDAVTKNHDKAAGGRGRTSSESRAEGRAPPAFEAELQQKMQPPASLVELQRKMRAPASPLAVQRMIQGSARGRGATAIHEAAARGTSGFGGPVPFYEQIQTAFGRHDVGGVEAYTGSSATEAAHSMGAMAYTTGTKIAFAGAPSLHTAAHEAAHAVQQRAGVRLTGGVGQAGDAYERHADAVADAVVAGRSAEALLDACPLGGSGAAVQRKPMVVKKSRGIGAGTRRVFGGDGTVVATIAGGTTVEIDDTESILIGGDSAYRLDTPLSAPTFTPVNKRGFGLSSDGKYYIKAAKLTPAPATEPEVIADPDLEPEPKADGEALELAADFGAFNLGYSDGTGTVAIPIGGQTLTFQVDKSGAVSGKIEGEIPEKLLDIEIPGFNYSVDFPIPGAPWAYVTAGIEFAPTLELGFGGGAYALQLSLTGGDHSLEFNADVKGSLDVTLTAKAGVGVGAANLVGIDAGAFVSAGGSAAVNASLKGLITASNKEGWKSGSLSLEDISATMAINGKAGAYLEAKAIGGMFSASKKYKLLEKEIGVFTYEREAIPIVKAGMDGGKLGLTIGDFELSSTKDEALVEDMSTPLLSRSATLHPSDSTKT